MSTGANLPGWLREQHEQANKAANAKQQRALAEMRVRAEGPAFWKALREELELIADNPPAGLWSKFSHSNFATSRHEDHCRVAVGCASVCPRLAHADLWFRPGDSKIRCLRTLDGAEFCLALCVANDRICAATSAHPEPMDAEETARYIVQPMNLHAIQAL